MKKLLVLGIAMLMAAGMAFANGAKEGTAAAGPIKVGGLYDRSGDFALISMQKYMAAQLAIEEINAAGGLLGRQIELIAPDTQSDPVRFQEMARQLILQDHVVAIHGCMASLTREAVRGIMEQYKMPFFYNNQYEGGVASKYTFCTGLVPEQQVTSMMEYMVKTYGPNYYIIAADYSAGIGTADWVKYIGAKLNAKNVGEEYIPLSVGQFASSIDKIKAAKPDFVEVHLTGITQNSFWGQWASSGMTIPTCSTFVMVQAYEHKRFAPGSLAGHYVTTCFTEEAPNPEAVAFVKKMRAKFPSAPYFGMEAESEYTGINLWAQAVRNAGTTESGAVIAALEKGITLKGMPGGDVTLRGEDHQCVKNVWALHADKNNKLVFDQNFKQVVPFWLHDVMGVDLRVSAPNKQFTIADMKKQAD
jgi:branched-chain amino acid transport system substrate-binding protein